MPLTTMPRSPLQDDLAPLRSLLGSVLSNLDQILASPQGCCRGAVPAAEAAVDYEDPRMAEHEAAREDDDDDDFHIDASDILDPAECVAAANMLAPGVGVTFTFGQGEDAVRIEMYNGGFTPMGCPNSGPGIGGDSPCDRGDCPREA